MSGKRQKKPPSSNRRKFPLLWTGKASTEENKSINRIDMMCIVILNTKEE
jgi:hypothetical protein